jgi:hypothetical protein
MTHFIKIYENDICIGVNTVSKDKVIEVQEIIKENKYKSVLEDILNHIDSNLISLESSGYLRNEIIRVLS